MHFSVDILLWAGLAFSLVASAPAPAPARVQKRGHFKVERVRNSNFKRHNGPRQLLKSLSKYSMPVSSRLRMVVTQSDSDHVGSGSTVFDDLPAIPEAQAEGQAHRGNRKASDTGGRKRAEKPGNGTAAGIGSVPATPEKNDVEFLSPVEIGGQKIHLDFDTGSSDLWVFNTQLSAESSSGHALYDPTQSASFQMMQGASFSISYGDGSGASGLVGIDEVKIGGAVVESQAIELATAVTESFAQDAATDGLLGLAFSQNNQVKPQKQNTFFDNVKSTLAEPVFTADLRANAIGAYEVSATTSLFIDCLFKCLGFSFSERRMVLTSQSVRPHRSSQIYWTNDIHSSQYIPRSVAIQQHTRQPSRPSSCGHRHDIDPCQRRDGAGLFLPGRRRRERRRCRWHHSTL